MKPNEFMDRLEKRYGQFERPLRRYYVASYVASFTPVGLERLWDWTTESHSASFGPPDIAVFNQILQAHQAKSPRGWEIDVDPTNVN